MTIIVAVTNYKGGTTKTTSAGYLLRAFQEAGQNVIGVDADAENESLSKWQVLADWTFPVITLAVPNMHKQLPGVIGDRYDVVVIDTPPLEEQKQIVRSAVRLATHIVVPMAPTGMDFERLTKVKAMIDEVTDDRSDGIQPVTAVLFNRVNPNPQTASTLAYRELVTNSGWTVLQAQVTFNDATAQAFGDPLKRADRTPFADAVAELLDLEAAR